MHNDRHKTSEKTDNNAELVPCETSSQKGTKPDLCSCGRCSTLAAPVTRFLQRRLRNSVAFLSWPDLGFLHVDGALLLDKEVNLLAQRLRQRCWKDAQTSFVNAMLGVCPGPGLLTRQVRKGKHCIHH